MTQLIIVGGFLGAGKTTLLWHTAQQLIQQGKKVALITNDQAPELVDSTLLHHQGLQVAEVNGSCFCCNFNGFVDAIHQLMRDVNPDVILAEPVGSCADLSATILQPVKRFLADELQLMPFTVLADPHRLSSILEGGNGGLHPDAAYIFRKQMEESDLLLLTKSDAFSDSQQEHLLQQLQQQYPSSRVLSVSAQSGAGIAEWLNALQQHQRVGERLLSIDYDKYAHGEAVLGWLNATLRITAPEPTDWNALLHQLMDGLSAELKQQQIPVGHVKAIIENANAFAVCNLTHTDFPSTFRGDAGTSTEATLTINARAETTPTYLEQLVRAQLQQLLPSSFRQEELAWKSLQPGRPNPTHRFTVVL